MTSNNPYEGLIVFDTPEKYVVSQESLFSLSPSLTQTAQQRGYGRWSLKESQIYLEVLKNCEEHTIIRELKKAIPTRL